MSYRTPDSAEEARLLRILLGSTQANPETSLPPRRVCGRITEVKAERPA